MRILFSAFAIFFFAPYTAAQMGFTAAYYSQKVPEWENTILGERSNEKILSSGYSAELDFKFMELENYRVEMYPTLAFSTSSSTLNIPDQLARDFNLNQYDFSINTKIFILSLEADCDCPTFSKDAGILEKGFFVQFAPGISYFQSKIEEERIIAKGNGLSFKLGIGMGVEIGLSDNFTISPLVKYNRYFNANWEGLRNDIAAFDQVELTGGNDATSISQFYAGLRLGIRFKR